MRKTTTILFLTSVSALAACGQIGSSQIVAPEQFDKAVAECGHTDARLAGYRTSTSQTDEAVTLIEVPSETMQLTPKDRCLQKELRAIGAKVELKLVNKNLKPENSHNAQTH